MTQVKRSTGKAGDQIAPSHRGGLVVHSCLLVIFRLQVGARAGQNNASSRPCCPSQASAGVIESNTEAKQPTARVCHVIRDYWTFYSLHFQEDA